MFKQKKSELRPTLGPAICDWIEEFLVHGPGDVQGQPIELDWEFRAFIYTVYEVYPQGHAQEGQRYYYRAIFSRPKGRAKSELAAMLACAEALGPVRFAGWDDDGNPIGESVTAPVIRCFATEEGQASNTYDCVMYMLLNGAVSDEYGLTDIAISRTNLPDGGEIVAQSSKAQSKDGGKDTFDVFDETHLWKTPALRELHAVVTRNLSKRSNGWSLETTTMYGPGEDSVAEMSHKTARKVAGVHFDHKQAPLTLDITDDVALRKALVELYGPASSWMNLDRLIANEFRDPQKRESSTRRYFLNQPWTMEERFTTPQAWDALADPSRNPEKGAQVVLAFDGSYNNDATALIGVTVDEKPHVFVVGIWQKTVEDPDDWVVDVEDVEAAIRRARALYNVVELTADVSRWQRSLEIMKKEGCNVSSFPQTDSTLMTSSTNRFSDLIAVGGMTHDGNPQLRAHVTNAVLKGDDRKRLAKVDKHSVYKIDAAVATLMGLARAGALVNQPVEYAHIFFPKGYGEAPEPPTDMPQSGIGWMNPPQQVEEQPMGWLDQQYAMQAAAQENAE